MLGATYISFLEQRLTTLPMGSHGLVFLPYFLFLQLKRREHLVRMMHEILVAEKGWEQREAAVGGYLRELVGNEPNFWDFCHYIILNVDVTMKEDAMLWLAYQKGYPLQGLVLPDALAACVHELDVSQGADPGAKAVLDSLHADAGQFSVRTGP